MSGIKSAYTFAAADVKFQYSREHRARAFGFMPSVACKAVIVSLHGGGWIAGTNISNAFFAPSTELFDKTLADALLAAGVALYFIEYPYGWHANEQARVHPCYRFPQIPRAIGHCIQYIKTHALDGLASGSMSLALPQSDDRFAFWGNSAGSVMATWIALQPDGFLRYDPVLRAQSLSPFAYTHSHRVRLVVAQDCATDFRKFGAATASYGGISAAALPYFAPSGALYKDELAQSTVLVTDRFSTVPTNIKAVASPLVAAEADYPDNLEVAFLLSNAIDADQSTYLNSGVTLKIDATKLTGTPVAGETVTTSGTPAGTFRYYDSTNAYIYIDGTAGTISQWLAITSASFATSGATLASGGVLAATGDDNRKTFLNSAGALAIWDALDESEGIEGLNQAHQAIFALPFKRTRDAQFVAASLTSIDRYRIGNRYTASLDSLEPAHPWNATTIQDDVIDHMTDLGMLA